MALPTDDWLLHNASEYTINGKTYRNLEAQVLKNKRDIEELQQGGIELPIVQEINEESTADTIPSAKAVFDDVLSYAEAIADDVVDLQGDLSALDGKALKVPLVAPTEKRLVGVDTANSQIMVNVGNTLKLDGTTSPYTLNVKNPVSGNYSGNNWANITINGVTKNIPSGGSSTTELFWCEYGVTTYAEVQNAVNAGMLPIVDYGGRIYTLTQYTSVEFGFICLTYSTVYRAYLKSPNIWQNQNTGNEVSYYKVQTIDASSSTQQYPSAKAVYNALQAITSPIEIFECTVSGISPGEILTLSNGKTWNDVTTALSNGKLVYIRGGNFTFNIANMIVNGDTASVYGSSMRIQSGGRAISYAQTVPNQFQLSTFAG